VAYLCVNKFQTRAVLEQRISPIIRVKIFRDIMFCTWSSSVCLLAGFVHSLSVERNLNFLAEMLTIRRPCADSRFDLPQIKVTHTEAWSVSVIKNKGWLYISCPYFVTAGDKFASLKKKHARGLFTAVEDLFNCSNDRKVRTSN
jgi:hypothetical protein